jgi:hypothetical protein
MGKLALFIWCVAAFAQTPPAVPPPAPDRPVVEAQGLPPRAAPSDYRDHAQAGAVTIAADFAGHSVATPEGILTTEDYVVIEAGLFGPPDAKLMLSVDDFSLRINGKKAVLRQPYELVVKSLTDPDYEPPASSSSASKTSVTGSGKGGADLNAPPPPPPRIPPEVRRAWELRVRKASLPSGDRTLPQAGLLFFSYGGKTEGVRSIELTYNGPAGKATVSIRP